jgi:hypothetical protein
VISLAWICPVNNVKLKIRNLTSLVGWRNV